MAYGAEDWAKAKALYLSGHTYDEVSEETGISLSQLKRKGSAEAWTAKRDQIKTETALESERKVLGTLIEQSSDAAVDVLFPLKMASTALVQQAMAMVPTCERASDVRALSGAIKDLLGVIRDLNDLPGYRDRIEAAEEDNTVRFIVEGYDGD